MCHSIVMNGVVASLGCLPPCLCFVVVVVFVCCVLCDVVIITAGGVGEATPAGGRVAKDGAEG